MMFNMVRPLRNRNYVVTSNNTEIEYVKRTSVVFGNILTQSSNDEVQIKNLCRGICVRSNTVFYNFSKCLVKAFAHRFVVCLPCLLQQTIISDIYDDLSLDGSVTHLRCVFLWAFQRLQNHNNNPSFACSIDLQYCIKQLIDQKPHKCYSANIVISK